MARCARLLMDGSPDAPAQRILRILLWAKGFSELNDSLDLGKSGPYVCLVTDGIVEQRVRRHLGVTAPTRPLIRGFKQRSAVSGPAHIGIYVPGFYVADWARATTIGVGAAPHFHIPADGVIRPFRDEHRRVVALEKSTHFRLIVFGRLVGKKGFAHAPPVGPIPRFNRSNPHPNAKTENAITVNSKLKK